MNNNIYKNIIDMWFIYAILNLVTISCENLLDILIKLIQGMSPTFSQKSQFLNVGGPLEMLFEQNVP